MSSPLTQLTPQGMTVANLAQRLAQLVSKIQALPGLGPDVDVDPDSLDGQILGIMAESFNNLDQLAQQVQQSFNPNTATGVALSLICLLNGITRQPGFFSLVPLALTGTPGETVPAGSLVDSTDGSTRWQTENDITFDGSGHAAVSAQCTVMGPFVAPIYTLTKIITPVYGWDTVTNSAEATSGSYAETDAQLRSRRAASTSTPAQSINDSIQGAIAQLLGVTQVRVYENPDDTTDSNGMDPHSIKAVVQGGTQADILKAFWLHKSLGPKILGTITGTVLDSQGNPHTLKYDTPTEEDIYVIVNLTPLPDYPTDGDAQIKAAIVAWGSAMKIGQEVVQSQLYIPILSVSGVSIDSLYIGTVPTPTTSANIVTAYDAIATFKTVNIIVNS
jgi:uncharacterized phage protein gp47/JayE